MRDYVEILFKNNSILRRRIKNPAKNIKITYNVDGKKRTDTYFYKREKTYKRKGIFFSHRVTFYEHGNPEPLDSGFKNNNINMQDIKSLMETDLIRQLASSTKNKDLGMTTGAIIAVTAIIALVVIVLIG
jgi:hypothetical protein